MAFLDITVGGSVDVLTLTDNMVVTSQAYSAWRVFFTVMYNCPNSCEIPYVTNTLIIPVYISPINSYIALKCLLKTPRTLIW